MLNLFFETLFILLIANKAALLEAGRVERHGEGGADPVLVRVRGPALGAARGRALVRGGGGCGHQAAD